MEQDNFTIGYLCSQVEDVKSTLIDIKMEQKAQGKSIEALQNWKTEVIVTCSVASGIISTIFYVVTLAIKWPK